LIHIKLLIVGNAVAIIMNQNLTWCCTECGPRDVALHKRRSSQLRSRHVHQHRIARHRQPIVAVTWDAGRLIGDARAGYGGTGS
jgi:hypothetical protein